VIADSPAGGSPRRWGRRWLVLVLLLPGLCCLVMALLLAAIIFNNWLAPPATADDLRRQLGDKVDEVGAVWFSLDDLWGRLAAGQPALCSEEQVTHPYFVDWRAADRSRYPDLAALADQLNGAIRSLHSAADAWTAVCQGGDELIPQATADEARAALDRAAEGLMVVTQALQDGTGP